MPDKLTHEIASKRLAAVTNRYELVEYRRQIRGKNQKSTIREIATGRTIDVHFSPTVDRFRRLPNYDPGSPMSVRKTKRKKTNVERFGFEDPMQNPEVKARQEAAIEEKFGVKNVFQAEEIKEKIKETVREKYDVDHISQSPTHWEKVKQTNLEKRGVEHHSQTEEFRELAARVFHAPGVQEKRKATNLEKYGHENAAMHPDVKAKAVATNEEKYGGPSPFSCSKVRKRGREKCKEVHGDEYPMRAPSFKRKLADLGKIATIGDKLLTDVVRSTGKSDSSVRRLKAKGLSDEQLSSLKPRRSYLEDVMEAELIKLQVKYIHNKQLEGTTYRPDFVLPDHNVIVECDGLYYHSDAWQEDDDYHVKKLEAYEALGYKLLCFREDEINNKLDICVSILKNALGMSGRVGARKCQVVKVESREADKFFDKFHLMGKGKSGPAFILVQGDVPVAGMRIRWKDKKRKIAEISRFCTAGDVSVAGGFSKLVAAVVKDGFDFRILETFIDRRYGSGSYLKDLGFNLFPRSGKSFGWVTTTGGKVFHRGKFTGNSGYDHGYYKIWDCGQARWDLDLTS